jgi:hypothetical protein
VPTQKSRMTYDDVVATLPNLDTEEQINLLEALYSVLKESVMQKKKEYSLLELEGLGAEIWSKLDVEKYISRERDSWN